MCDEYWEREYLKRLRLLASEDEFRWIEQLEKELPSVPEAVLLPGTTVVEDKKRPARTLAR